MRKIFLASQSRVRRRILEDAGVCFEVDFENIEERLIEKNLKGLNAGASEIALALAKKKAAAVSIRRPTDWIIGADQVLESGEKLFGKPDGLEGARRRLQSLRGGAHYLHSAVCLTCDGEVVWQYIEVPRLTMRNFSDDFLEKYIDLAGERICDTVGAYCLESIGVQLFEEVRGDYFSQLGLPLFPLLTALRQHGLIKE